MKINDFLNDNFIILKTMYDNQVTVLNETQIPLSQIQIADALGYSKNKVYSVLKNFNRKDRLKLLVRANTDYQTHLLLLLRRWKN